jgi:hypothetical protein
LLLVIKKKKENKTERKTIQQQHQQIYAMFTTKISVYVGCKGVRSYAIARYVPVSGKTTAQGIIYPPAIIANIPTINTI